MAKYLVGTSENAWDFNAAYNAANDGDTLVFEEGYSYSVEQGKQYNITKSLNLVGNIVYKDSQTIFQNTLYGKYVVKNKAKVTFSNLWFSNSQISASLVITDGSEVGLDRVVLESTNGDNNHAIVFSDRNSQVVMTNVEVKASNDNSSFKFSDSSSVKIIDSNLKVRLICDSQSKLELNNVLIENFASNVINSRLSDIVLINSTIKGGNIEKDFPAVWAKRSTLTVDNSFVIQTPYHGAVCLNDSSGLKCTLSDFSSLSLYDSRAVLNDTVIGDILYVNDQSFVSSKGNLQLKGENDEKIDLYVGGESVLIADHISISRVFDPNIRLAGKSFVHLEQLDYVEGDNLNINKEVSEDSYFNIATNSHKNKKTADNSRLDAKEELDRLIGLNQVKQEITKMLRMVDFNNKRIEQGLSPEKQALHAVFMGNPGTGKTTVARLIGDILHSKGALSGEELIFVEASESDLISNHVGETAIQTQALLEKARGGILFIDEAYTLNKKGSSTDWGIEAINTILKFMEDYRDEIMIIFAGYTKEMEQFLKTNSGLASRVPNIFNFEDYTGDEIVQMGHQILEKGNYQLEDDDYYERTVKREYANSLDNGNARWIRNFNEKLVKALADRVIEEGSEDITTVRNQDIDSVTSLGKFDGAVDKRDALERLHHLIGISKVKQQVDEFVALAEMNKQREEAGYNTGDFSLHTLFLGNPGTGKTTVARIVGDVLYQKGVISHNKFVEITRSDLVAGYIGQTAIKTREVLESALGGVLFIDEAYTLNAKSGNDFGQEALDEILKFMEDHRRDIVIIFAGYTKEMSEFLQMNSGLESRIPNTFDFEDYTPDEIVEIGLLGLKHQDYQVDVDGYTELVKWNYMRDYDNSNGRWVRNLNERLIRSMSSRVTKTGSSDLSTIINEDLENIRER